MFTLKAKKGDLQRCGWMLVAAPDHCLPHNVSEGTALCMGAWHQQPPLLR